MKIFKKIVQSVVCVALLAVAQFAFALPRAQTIQWDDDNLPEIGVTGYNLYRLMPGAAPVKINTTLITQKQYSLTVDNGWQLVVRAVNADGESGDSNVLTIPTVVLPPAPPTNLRQVQ